MAVESLPMDDAQRKKMGAWHVTQGRAFEDRSFLEKALAEYRRALILDPTSADGRVGYARIYRSLGFPAKYLSELQVLAKLGSKDTFVSDEIERMTSVLSDSVSRQWGYDQYNLDRSRYVIPVYTLASGNRLVHSLISDDLARYFASLMGRYDSIIAPDVPPAVTGFDQAFRAARTAGTDYFILVAFDESDRSFSATVDLYLARTGGRIASFAAFRTGNDRVRDSLMKLAGQVAELLSPKGTLLTRKFGQGCCRPGLVPGAQEGRCAGHRPQGHGTAPFGRPRPSATTRRTSLATSRSRASMRQSPRDRSPGRGYFDYVNTGDQVVYPVKKVTAPTVSPVQRSGNILTRIFGIRG